MRKLIVPFLTLSHVFIELTIFDMFLKHYIIETESVYWNFVSLLQIFTLFYTGLCYLSASYMNPGYLTKSVINDMDSDFMYVDELDENGEKCFCFKCNTKKPLRCHHCSQCNKCVLVYEHHCSFINNCVGHRNFKSFYLFMFSWIINAIVNILVLIRNMIFEKMSMKKWVFVIICCIFFVVIGTFVVPQFIQQSIFLFRNMTSVELENNIKNLEIFKKYNALYFHRFDTGNIRMNISCRLGNNPFLWFLPTPNNDQGYRFVQSKFYVPLYELILNNEEDDDENLDPQERLAKAMKRKTLINGKNEF